jgi:hypothetical protein
MLYVRIGIAIAFLLVLTGCGSGAKNATQGNAKVAACTERMLKRIHGGPQVKSYIESTYCRPFAQRGWVYADGTLRIDAHLWLLKGSACTSETSTPGGPTITLPCDAQAAALDPLECAVLHYVRRAEVRAYIRELKRSQRVRCDDGTPLDQLGVA